MKFRLHYLFQETTKQLYLQTTNLFFFFFFLLKQVREIEMFECINLPIFPKTILEHIQLLTVPMRAAPVSPPKSDPLLSVLVSAHTNEDNITSK